MQSKYEKRNSEHGIDSTPTHRADLFGGVGGRQTSRRPSRRGGGYLDKCTVLNFSPDVEQKKRDPRLDELREMGLQRVWLDVAEEIGVDALLKMWRILDRDQASIGDDGRILVPIRSYSTFLRYQRNRYIESLSNMGMKAKQIREKLKEQLCENISIRRLNRLTQQD